MGRGSEGQAEPGEGNRAWQDDAGLIRLDFQGYSGAGELEEISWDAWFEKFEEGKLGLLIQEKTADGETSSFNKLVKRDEHK